MLAARSMNRIQIKALGITLMLVALALGITGIVRGKQPLLYSATALVKVERQKTDLPELTGLNENAASLTPGLDQTYFIETEIATVQSDATLSKVIARLDLNREWSQRFNPGQPLAPEETLQVLKARVSARPGPATEQIAITASGDTADEAAKLANATAEAYGEYRVDHRRRLTQTALDLVAGSYAEMEKQMAAASEKVAAARQRLDPAWQTPAADNRPTAESDALRALQSRYSKSALRYLTQSNQVALFPAKNPGDEEVVAELKAKAEQAHAEMVTAEAALRGEIQKQVLLKEYQAALFEVEDLNQRFAPLRKRVEELRTAQSQNNHSAVEIVEPAATPTTPAAQAAPSSRTFLVGSAAVLALGAGFWVAGRKPKVASA